MFRHVFEKLDGFNEVLWRSSRSHFRFGATVHQVLLGKLHEEVSIEFDVEL